MCKPDLDRRRIPPNLQYAARLSLSRRLPSSASNESVAPVSFVYLADSIRVHFLKLKRRSERQEHGAPTEALTEIFLHVLRECARFEETRSGREGG
jgi:hypothetical protein